MTTIRVTSRNAAGDPIPRAKVTVRLVAGPRPTDPGYFTTGDYSIVTGSEHLTNQAGNLELDLASTDDGEMDPPGCFYLITAAGAKRTIEVPATGDYDWGDPDIALIDPASPDASHGLPAGGTDGQVLTKVGTTPYSAGWEDAASAGSGVSQVDFDAHLADSTNVHGITNTALLATAASVTTVATNLATETARAQAAEAAAQAFAIQRANHTGTQAPSTITGTAVVDADSRLTNTRTPTDGTVTTAKIAAGAVTADKLAVPGWQVIHDRTLGSTSSSESFALTGTQWRVRILGRVSATGSGSVTLRATLNSDTSSLYSSAGGALAASFDLSNMAASQTNTNRPTAIDFHLSSHPGQWALGYVIPLVMASTAALSPGSAAPRPVVWESTALPVSIELFPASSTFETGCRFIIEAMA